MDRLDGESLVRRYADWLRAESSADSCDGDACKIELPYMNSRRNHLQVYVSRTDAGLTISDLGETVGDLGLRGFDIGAGARRRKLDGLLRSFGVSLVGEDLRIAATEDDFPRRLNELAHCMMAVDGMIETSPSRVARLFEEDSQKAEAEKKGAALAGG